MIAGGELDGRHLSVSKSNSLAFSGHEYDFLVDLDAGLEAKQTRNHQLGAVCDGVNGAVFDDDTLVRREKRLEGRDDLAQIAFVAVIVVHPLRIEDVVECDHAGFFALGA
jgi:hypothetical protein